MPNDVPSTTFVVLESVVRLQRQRRQYDKQVYFGKCTTGYKNYMAAVPVGSRNPSLHPMTPRFDATESKRTRDANIKSWRRALHEWDDSTTPLTSSSDEEKEEEDNTSPSSDGSDYRPPPPRGVYFFLNLARRTGIATVANGVADRDIVLKWERQMDRGTQAWESARSHPLFSLTERARPQAIQGFAATVPTKTDAAHREMVDLKRKACDSFFTALKTVGQAWVSHGGALGLDWMQRQLVTENNIAIILYALHDTREAVHFMHSVICLLTDIEDQYGTSPWLAELDQSVQWLVLAIRQRQSDEETLVAADDGWVM